MFIAPTKNAASDYNTAFHILVVRMCMRMLVRKKILFEKTV